MIFRGNFNDKRIILNHPVYLRSDNARLLDSVIKVESDNVIVNGLVSVMLKYPSSSFFWVLISIFS